MKAHAVIAVRGGPAAKSRPHHRLGSAECEALVAAMMMDMLSALHSVEDVTKIWVITPTPMLASFASDCGASIIDQTDCGGLNAAFGQARNVIAAQQPDTQILLLPGDLPLLTAHDVRQVLDRCTNETLVIARANADGGTGALAFAAACAMPFAFGVDSFARHVELATAIGLKVETVDAPGLSLDIDHPSDLDTLMSRHGGGRTGALLAHWRAAA
jgi:2-phospho-L-lactate/phosphoenolpyruvate guanylyltransferase